MRFRVTIKVAIYIAVVLFSLGIAVSMYSRLSVTEQADAFDLYTLVPPSATTIVETDNVVGLVKDINDMACSKDGHFFYFSKLFTHLKDHINTLVGETPHGLSRYMNRMIVSFHEPESDKNQVYYCRLGVGDHEIVEKFIKKYCTSTFPSKYFDYLGEEIRIYPMPNDEFLVCYLTSQFLAVSYQKKLIEEVIDAHLSEKSVLSDPAFAEVRTEKKMNTQATIYTKTGNIAGWTGFNMKLTGDAVYLSGVNYDDDSLQTYASVLKHQQQSVGFPGDMLPASTFCFHKTSLSDVHSMFMYSSQQEYARVPYSDHIVKRDRDFYYYLQDNATQSATLCLFEPEEVAEKKHVVLNISLQDMQQSIVAFEEMLKDMPTEEESDLPQNFLFTTPVGSYKTWIVPTNSLFTQLTGVVHYERLYVCFYKDQLLLAPDADSLSAYIQSIDKNETLVHSGWYEEGMAGLSDHYGFLMMADLDRVLGMPRSYSGFIPYSLFLHRSFFQHFKLTVQITLADEAVYPNLVFTYSLSE